MTSPNYPNNSSYISSKSLFIFPINFLLGNNTAKKVNKIILIFKKNDLLLTYHISSFAFIGVIFSLYTLSGLSLLINNFSSSLNAKDPTPVRPGATEEIIF